MKNKLNKKIEELNNETTFFQHLRIKESNSGISFFFSFRMDTYVLDAKKVDDGFMFGSHLYFSNRTGEDVLESNEYKIKNSERTKMTLTEVLSTAADIYAEVSLGSVVRHFKELYTLDIMEDKDAILASVDNFKNKFKNIQIDFNGRDFLYENKSGDEIELKLNSEGGILINNRKKTKTPSVIENKVDVFNSINVFFKEVVKKEKEMRICPKEKLKIKNKSRLRR